MVKKSIILIISILVLGGSSYSQKSISPEQKSKIELLKRLEQFAVSHYGLKKLPDFYTTWQVPDTITAYLYISKADSVSGPADLPHWKFFGTNYHQADSESRIYQNMGYHTLIYKTAGNSGCKLTRRLLSYSNESIAFIAFHEMIHRHKQAGKYNIDYGMEESACDAFGFIALNEYIYSTKDPMLNKESAELLQKYTERFHQVLSDTIIGLQTKASIVHQLSKDAAQTEHAYFLGDRYNYPVNNAYILRNRFYNKYYFILKNLYISYGTKHKKYIKFIFKLKSKSDFKTAILLQTQKNSVRQ